MAYKIGGIDLKAKKEGVWKEFGGAKFLIKSLNQIDMLKIREEASVVNGESIELDQEKLAEQLALKALKGWEGVEDYDSGEPVEFTEESAKLAMIESDDLRMFVHAVAVNEANYLREKADKKVEKVKKPSTGA